MARYADDICTMGRMKAAMKQTCEELKRMAKEVGLSFSVNKTEIMVQSRCDTHTGKEMKIRGDMAEVRDEFFYLGTYNTKCRDEPKDMSTRVGLANNEYSLLPVMMPREVAGQAKLKLYKTLMRSVLWYGCKVQRRLQTAEKVLNEFEGKVLRKIYGNLLINGHWRDTYNQEIYKLLYKEMDLTRNIRLSRLQRVGQVMRLKDEREPRKAMKGQTGGRRPV